MRQISILVAASIVLLLPASVLGQAINKRPGEWTSYLSHNQAVDVALSTDTAYLASSVGLVYFDYSTGRITQLSAINRLSGTQPSCLTHDPASGYTLLGYESGLIDYFRSPNNIQTIRDIANAEDFLQRGVEEIEVYENRAYIATEFGIVVYDLAAEETRASYTQITLANKNEPVQAVEILRDTLWVHLKNGLYYADLNQPNLADGRAWTADTAYNTLTAGLNNANGEACDCRMDLERGQRYLYALKDTALFMKTDTGWTAYPDTQRLSANVLNEPVTDLHYNGQSCVMARKDFYELKPDTAELRLIGFRPRVAKFAPDFEQGVVSGQGSAMQVFLNGYFARPLAEQNPPSNEVFRLKNYGDQLAIGSSLYDQNNFSPTLVNTAGAYLFEPRAARWTNYMPKDSLFPAESHSFGAVAYNTANEQFYLGTFSNGLFVLKDGQLLAHYDRTNSPLVLNNPNFDGRVAGLELDRQNRLWVASYSPLENALLMLDPAGQWHSFSTPFERVKSIHIGPNGYKWLPVRDRGVMVYDEGGTPDEPNDDRSVLLNQNVGTGNLNSTQVNDVVTDQEGAVWVGTGSGVNVFYSTFNIFEATTANDAICPIFEGFCLLREENVTAVAVDGANRKYFGTENSGVFLFNADGTEQLAHFEQANSPLISNQIQDIAINQTTGEVFIGTASGIVSYQSKAIAGAEQMDDLYAFPNPVRPGFEGDVLIRGTVRDASAKVLTPDGRLVARIQSLGGQLAWDRRNFQGQRVSPGVYFIKITGPEGQERGLVKISILSRS